MRHSGVKGWLFVLAVALFGFSAAAIARNVLIINGTSTTSDPGTTSSITTNLQNIQTAAGNSVVVDDQPPGTLAGFDEVWDIRFSNSTPLTAGQQTLYLAFLQAGHAMYIMGENAGFGTRNNSVIAFVTSAGGGSLSFLEPGDTQTVLPPFNAPNAVSTIQYSAAGGSSNAGTGAFGTSNGSGGTMIAWKPGQLSNAASGALVVTFDVNYMETGAPPASQALLKNQVGFINAGGNVTPTTNIVPTLSEWALALMALLVATTAILALRRRS